MNKALITFMLTLTVVASVSCQKKEQPDNSLINKFSVAIKCSDNGEVTEWPLASDKKLFISDYEYVTGTIASSHPTGAAVRVTSSDPKVIAVEMESMNEFTLCRANGATYGEATIEVAKGDGNEQYKKSFTVCLQPEQEVILTRYQDKAGTIYAYTKTDSAISVYLTQPMWRRGESNREVTIPMDCINAIDEKTENALGITFKDNTSVSFPMEKARFSAAESVTLHGWKGDSVELPWSCNVSLDGLEPVFELSGDFFEVKDGKTVSATSDNRGSQREGTITISEKNGEIETVVVKVIQLITPPEGAIVFEDRAFEAEMVRIADNDNDGYVTKDEALTVTQIESVGKGIRNLNGLEYFKSVWKLDLRDNDIIDATCLKELPLLYWLDLKGNMNLKTFDVTGCSEYFEHCAFEVSEGFKYYGYTYQIGLNLDSDLHYDYRVFVPDNRQTTDWSHHKNTYMVKQHTKAMTKEEFPWLNNDQEGMVPTIVFTGLCYLDVDFQDGSWKRLMNEALRCYTEYSYILKEWGEYFDIYYMEYVSENRESNVANTDRYWQDIYDTIAGEDTTDKILCYNWEYCEPTKQFPAQLVINISCNKPSSWAGFESIDFFHDKFAGSGIALQMVSYYNLDHIRENSQTEKPTWENRRFTIENNVKELYDHEKWFHNFLVNSRLIEK